MQFNLSHGTPAKPASEISQPTGGSSTRAAEQKAGNEGLLQQRRNQPDRNVEANGNANALRRCYQAHQRQALGTKPSALTAAFRERGVAKADGGRGARPRQALKAAALSSNRSVIAEIKRLVRRCRSAVRLIPGCGTDRCPTQRLALKFQGGGEIQALGVLPQLPLLLFRAWNRSAARSLANSRNHWR